MDNAKSLGRGALYNFAARAVLVLTGYATAAVLARKLGPEQYGIYGVVTSLVFVVTVVLMTGIEQTTSKFISEKPKDAKAISYQMLKLQIGIGVAATIAYFLLSEPLATVLNDKSLVPYIRYTSLLIIFQSLFSVFTGYLNGLKKFKQQSLLNISYSVIKAILVIGFVLAGYSVVGALAGFVLSTAIGLGISFLLFSPGRHEPVTTNKKILGFGVPIVLFSSITILLMNIDLFFVKALSQASLANRLSGLYTAALLLSRGPYYIVTAITITIFPLISEFAYRKKQKELENYTKKSLDYLLIAITFIVFIVASTSSDVIRLIYGTDYTTAGPALTILSFGGGLFAVFLLLATIISASGRPKHSFLIGAGCLAVDFALNMVLVPRYQLVGAAIANTTSMLIAVIAGIYYIKKKFGIAVISRRSILTIITGIIIMGLSIVLPFSGILLILKYTFLGILYAGILYALKILDSRDLAFAKRIIKN
ncbi:MAG: flippase [Candidatus Woesearchaeota archaeon]